MTGGFVNSAGNNNPTYEFFPSRGDPITTDILTTTLPANLYPITFLLPSGNLLIQLNWATCEFIRLFHKSRWMSDICALVLDLLDYKTGKETQLDDVPGLFLFLLHLWERSIYGNHLRTLEFDRCGENISGKRWDGDASPHSGE